MRNAVAVFLLGLMCTGMLYGSDLPSDPALQAPLTIAAKGISLGDLAAAIEQQTGVRIRVSTAISDHKTTVFVDRMPLRDFMTSLATIFKYQWSASKRDNRFVYELWEDEVTRRGRESAYTKAWEKAWNTALAEIRQKLEYASMTPQELEGLKSKLKAEMDKNPTPQNTRRYGMVNDLCRQPFLGPLLRMVESSPRVLEALKNGYSVNYDWKSSEPEWVLPDHVQKAVLQQVDQTKVNQPGLPLQMNTDEMEIASMSLVISTSQDPSAVTVSVNGMVMYRSGNNSLGKNVAGTLTRQSIADFLPAEPDLTPADNPVSVPILSKRFEVTKDELAKEADVPPAPAAFPGFTVQKLDGGNGVTIKRDVSLRSDGQVKLDPSGVPILPGGQPASTMMLSRPEGMSEFARQLYGEQNGGTWFNRSDLLAVLHRKTGLQVISDHYSHWNTSPGYKEQTVTEILNACSSRSPSAAYDPYVPSWGWDGKVVYCRTKDVRYCDSAEVPNRLLAPWQEAYRKNGALGFDELAQMAALSVRQMVKLSANGRFLRLGQLGQVAFDAVRFYNSLSPGQKAEARADGIAIQNLTVEQQAALANLLAGSVMRFGGRVGIYDGDRRVDRPKSLPGSVGQPAIVKVRQPRFAKNGGNMDIVTAASTEEALTKFRAQNPDVAKEDIVQLDTGAWIMEVTLLLQNDAKLLRQFTLVQ